MLLVAVLTAMACSSSSSSAPQASCLSDPKSCGPGKTCWAVDTVPNFACVASGPAAFAAPCDDTIGQATCGDGLTCDQTSASKGTCTHFCDESTPCPSGYSCWETHAGSANGPSLLVCRPGVASGALDGGADDAGEGDGGLGGFDAKSDSPVTSR